MATTDLESIYRFELTTELKALVSGPARPASAEGETPGGVRLYLAYAEGKVTSPGIDDARVEREVEAVFARAFGKRLGELTGDDARGLNGCRDGHLQEAIRDEIQQSRSGESCSDSHGLRRFLERFCKPAELRRSRGPLARRLVEQSRVTVGLEGEVVSSGDWAFLRDDGVFCSDSRFTIAAVDGTLVSCHLQGRADLCRVLGGEANLHGYQSWQDGRGSIDRHTVPLHGVLRFEVSVDPGPKKEFAAPRWLRAGGCFWKYRYLNRGLFLATGSLVLDRKSGSHETGYATSLTLTVREVNAVALPRLVEDPADSSAAGENATPAAA